MEVNQLIKNLKYFSILVFIKTERKRAYLTKSFSHFIKIEHTTTILARSDQSVCIVNQQ